MKRFSHWIDINISSECAGMYETSKGNYVLHEEHQEREDFLVTALQSLKDCNAKLQSPEALNEFIDRTLQGFIHE